MTWWQSHFLGRSVQSLCRCCSTTSVPTADIWMVVHGSCVIPVWKLGIGVGHVVLEPLGQRHCTMSFFVIERKSEESSMHGVFLLGFTVYNSTCWKYWKHVRLWGVFKCEAYCLVARFICEAYCLVTRRFFMFRENVYCLSPYNRSKT